MFKEGISTFENVDDSVRVLQHWTLSYFIVRILYLKVIWNASIRLFIHQASLFHQNEWLDCDQLLQKWSQTFPSNFLEIDLHLFRTYAVDIATHWNRPSNIFLVLHFISFKSNLILISFQIANFTKTFCDNSSQSKFSFS